MNVQTALSARSMAPNLVRRVNLGNTVLLKRLVKIVQVGLYNPCPHRTNVLQANVLLVHTVICPALLAVPSAIAVDIKTSLQVHNRARIVQLGNTPKTQGHISVASVQLATGQTGVCPVKHVYPDVGLNRVCVVFVQRAKFPMAQPLVQNARLVHLRLTKLHANIVQSVNIRTSLVRQAVYNAMVHHSRRISWVWVVGSVWIVVKPMSVKSRVV